MRANGNTIRTILLPSSMPGIITVVILAMGELRRISCHTLYSQGQLSAAENTVRNIPEDLSVRWNNDHSTLPFSNQRR